MSFQAQTRDHKEGKMQNSSKTAASLYELLATASDEKVSRIVVRGTIADAPSIRLSRGQQLVGENENASILFRPDVDGPSDPRNRFRRRADSRAGGGRQPGRYQLPRRALCPDGPPELPGDHGFGLRGHGRSGGHAPHRLSEGLGGLEVPPTIRC